MWSYFGLISAQWPLIMLAYIGTFMVPALIGALEGTPTLGGKIRELIERAEARAYDSEGDPS